MPELDPDQAYSLILEALRVHRLSWVAAQIQDQVRAGKPTIRVVAPRATPMSNLFVEEVSPARPPRRERLPATEPYSPDERLALALDALEGAVLHTADMEREVISFFRSEIVSPTGVAFEPEEFEDTPRFEIETFSESRNNALAKLREVIVTLRREIQPGADH